MAVSPQVIHGYGVPPSMEPQNTGGGLPFGQVTIPFLDYKVPTVALVAFAVIFLFLLHLMGFTFVGVVGVSGGVR
jgi:hypothetical protein